MSALTLATPMAATKREQAWRDAPVDVTALFAAERSPRRRAVVLVVEPSNSAAMVDADRAVDALLKNASRGEMAPPQLAAGAQLAGAPAPADVVGGGGSTARDVLSNTVAPSPVAEAVAAISDAKSGESVRVARGLSDAEVSAFEVAVRNAATAANVERFALPDPADDGASFNVDQIVLGESRGKDKSVMADAALAAAGTDAATRPTTGPAATPSDSQRQAMGYQQVSGLLVPRPLPTTAASDRDDATVDVFVVVRPATPTSQPGSRPATTQPATTQAAN